MPAAPGGGCRVRSGCHRCAWRLNRARLLVATVVVCTLAGIACCRGRQALQGDGGLAGVAMAGMMIC
jgi:hypothetical protein